MEPLCQILDLLVVTVGFYGSESSPKVVPIRSETFWGPVFGPVFGKFLVALEVRLELLWPILGPLDLAIHLGNVLRLRIFPARAPELIWEPFFDSVREKCEGF